VARITIVIGPYRADLDKEPALAFKVTVLFRWISFWVTIFTLTVLIWAPMILISLIPRSEMCIYRMMKFWCWAAAKAAGLTFSIQGAEKAEPGVAYILTPNHQGNADILALVNMLPTPFRWVLKKELLRIPLFGWALARTGAISLDRSNRGESLKRLQQSSDKLKGGWSILIYPEGTRTSDGLLQPFKKGAFVLAVDSGIPILPITMNGAFKVLPKNKTFAFLPGHISLTIGDPIATEGLTHDDIPKLMEKTHAAVLKNLDVDFDPFNDN
jgi:1-acyl-sn-glycerol-3-phosphate acyltransferase